MSELVYYNSLTWLGGIRKDRLGCGGLRSLKKMTEKICGIWCALYFDRFVAATCGTFPPPPRADLVSASRNVPTGAIGFCAWQEALAMSEVSRETVHRGTDDPEEIRMLKEAQASPVSSVQ